MSLIQDLKFACRLIVKDKWFSAVVIVALSLGIGLNATVFTLVNGVLIRGLPFKDSHQLYILGTQRATDTGRTGGGNSYLDFMDWRSQVQSFSALAGFNQTSFNIADEKGLPEQAQGARLSANAFQVLGQQPLLGRDFAPDEDRKGAEPVVILGYTIWKNRYGSDPSVIGRPLRINGQPATIIGVMPDGMKFPTNADLWIPLVPTADQDKRSVRFFGAFGRIKPGVSRAAAQTEMNGIAARLVAAYPETNKDFPRIAVSTFNERFNGGNIQTVFLAMMGAVGFVLLIACANVANLLVSRSAQRTREIAVRVALGATRWRVVRQLLIESVVLGCLGGVLGLGLALGGVKLFDLAVADVGKPYWIRFDMDFLVFAFLAGICVLTGILFGFAPALQISRTNVNEVLKEGGRGSSGSRRARWLSGTMVVLELALTIVLLMGSGLLIRSFMKLYTLDLGFKTEHVMTMQMQVPGTKYKTADERRVFFERLEPKLASIPGVQAVAITTTVPPFGGGTRPFEIEGRPARKAGEAPPEAMTGTIGGGFFDVLNVPIRRGRTFHELDGKPGNENIIINEKMASRYFPGEDPLGKRLRFVPRPPAPGQPAPAPPAQPPIWRTIVGVSATILHTQGQNPDPTAVAYIPFRQEPPGGVSLLVRSSLEPGTVMTAVRTAVQAIDQDQPVFRLQTLDQLLLQQQWPFRVFGTLFSVFAAIALLLSSVGLYAVMAYSVTQRTQEIGVRMALGAEGASVTWLILRRGLIQLAIGLTLGVCGAYFAGPVLASVLVQITGRDPMTLVAITVLLSIVAIAACVIPARRATRVDPLIALRAE
jgi:putative ABC transport system permease protein